MTGPRISKADLIEIIQLAYAAGYGPRHIAKMTGYSYVTIQAYATTLGLKNGTTRPKPPTECPRELLIVLMKVGATDRVKGRL